MTKGLFTEIADVYDRMNRILSLGLDIWWRRRAIALVGGEPARILDLACGTGDLTFALAARFPRATVVGVDLTPAMLARARARNTRPNVCFFEGDAQKKDFSIFDFSIFDCSIFDFSIRRFVDWADERMEFQLISCAFGFRNFPDKDAALGEVCGHLVPGGELLVLEFFRPQGRLRGWLVAGWVRALAVIFGGRRASAYAYLRESMRTTDSESAFIARAKAFGLDLVRRKFYLPCCTCLVFARRAQAGS